MIDLSCLDDATAERVLTSIARVQPGNRSEDMEGLRQALEKAFQTEAQGRSSPGDFARQALEVLAEDPQTRAAIETMASEKTEGVYAYPLDGGTILLSVAALFALRTGVDIERDKTGKWSFKLKVKPAGESAVKKLVEKLIHYLPG